MAYEDVVFRAKLNQAEWTLVEFIPTAFRQSHVEATSPISRASAISFHVVRHSITIEIHPEIDELTAFPLDCIDVEGPRYIRPLPDSFLNLSAGG
jgi:hypothetical protein